EQLTHLSFGVLYQGRHLRVRVGAEEATYTLASGDDALRLHHHGEAFEVTADKPTSLPIPRLHPTPRPSQPAGRAPQRRHPHAKTK
ncbi:MAG TPA: glycosyl hydrolase family 65 protein, partial [Mycobacteriales bacterium]|nr:glycosyl hydrolase family 65 protein [Mycobacteriales bacterium]